MEVLVNLSFGIGAFFYVISSLLMILMWQVNHFGLTLLKQLNVAMRAGGVVSLSRANQDGQTGLRVHLPSDAQIQPKNNDKKVKFSIRGVVFIMLYCWFIFVALINMIIMQLRYEHMQTQYQFFHLCNMASQVFIVLVLKCVLIIHSAVTHVPNEQPYRFALFLARFVCLMGTVFQTLSFVHFFTYPMFQQ